MRGTSRRKRIGMVLGLLLLAGLGWLFWPFVAGPGQMQAFCGALAAGTPLEQVQVQVQAAQHGYRMSPLQDGRAFVHDPGAFGRFTCTLQFGTAGLVSSFYALND